jgi:P27 family predicted phage terminase small subunit
MPGLFRCSRESEVGRTLSQVLGETGLLTTADRDAMAMYYTAFSQWREAADMVKKSGLVIKGAGGVCANPCVAIAANAKREMRELSALLGLDPASRSRLRVNNSFVGHAIQES